VSAGPASTRRGRRLADRPLLHDHPVALRIALWLWAFGNLLFVVLAVPALADIVQRIDDAVHRVVVAAEWSPLVAIAHVLDFLGSTWVTAPIMVLVAAYLAWRTRWEALATWVAAMVASQLLIGPVKAVYERGRPPLSLVETSGFSFPSGHSVAGAAIAVALVIVLVPAGPKRRNLEMMAAVFAVVMALSRVYLRAHWLSDVAAGAALGAGVAMAAAAIVHWIDERTHPA
jgi:membrane-associated phospholipid phosphatase